LEIGNFGFLENFSFLIAFDVHMNVCLLQLKALKKASIPGIQCIKILKILSLSHTYWCKA